MAGSVLGGIAAAVELRGVLDDVGDEPEVEQAAEEDAVTDAPDVDDSAVDDACDLNGDVLDDRSPKSGVVQSWQSG